MKSFLEHLTFLGLLIVTLTSTLYSQTLIINEVSQGESGNKEYIELIVVDSTANYNCAEVTPPSIDIRNWIIDDNSGYHGPNGIASGAVRFSNDPTWSAVPLGTIILLYNDADFNPEIQNGTVTLADGTCQINAPISDPQLFESNPTTPGAIACSYPASGWVAGGNWNHITLRNGGDCARIVDLSGCEVFSLCWGDVNQDTEIYFSGSASNKVYYFNNGNPSEQTNWSAGCADLSACGTQDQTPGFSNSSANTSFIGQFNNNCAPITPVEVSANVVQSPYCIDNGIVSGSASGSIPGYTYNWYNSDFSVQLDSNQVLDSIGAGTYNLVAISSIGCDDTTSITISAIDTTIELSLSDTSICAPQQVDLTGAPSILGGEFNWNNQGLTSSGTFSVNVTQSSTYPVSYVLGSCSVDSTINVQVGGGQVVSGQDTTICEGSSIDLLAIGANSYTWSTGEVNGASIVPSAGINTFSVIGNEGTNCESFDTIVVTVIPMPVPNVSVSTLSGNVPLNVDFNSSSSNTSALQWDFGNGATSVNQNEIVTYEADGVYTVTLNLSNDICSVIWTEQIIVDSPIEPLIVKIPNVFTPNSDGIDDFYYLPIENAASLEAVILNRWGNVVKEMNKIDDVWDGTFNGEPVSEGTYFIKYKIVGLDDSVEEGHTFLQLIR